MDKTNIPLDFDKLKQEVLYVLSKTGEIDFHKLFKILYFADIDHLAKYGRAIVANDYVAMPNGPVPQTLYTKLTKLRNFSPFNFGNDLKDILQVKDNKFIVPIQKPNLDFLSRSDIQSLDTIIEWALPMSFQELTDLSHGTAYRKVYSEAKKNNPISVFDMAEEGGATQDSIREMKYIDYLYSLST